MKRIAIILMALALLVSILLCSCGDKNPDDTDSSSDSKVTDSNKDTNSDTSSDTGSDKEDNKNDDKDNSTSVDAVIEHNLKVDNCINMGIFDSEDTFGKEGNTVDYTSAEDVDVSEKANGKPYVIQKSGTYRIHGTSANGQILINLNNEEGGDGNVVLVLDNLNLTYEGTKSVIYAEKCKSVKIVIPQDTTSTLTDSIYNGEKGVIHVKSSDLTLDGKGTLSLNAKSLKGRGIFNTKTLTINGGIYNVTTEYSHGIQGEQGLIINGGTFTINSAKSGLKTGDYDENKPAEAVVGSLTINGGSFNINSATNGISAYGSVTVNNGRVNINATTDGIDVSEIATFNGGITIVNALDDGIKSDRAIVFAGNSNVKVLSANDGIDAVTVNVSTKGVVFIQTNVNDKAFIEDPEGSYIIKNGRYTLVDVSRYPNETHYSLESCKGIKLDGALTVTDGILAISAYEDAIDSLDALIEGGRVVIESKDDGLDISGKAVINGTLEIINSNKGIKSASVEVNENGIATIISTSDAIDSPLVTVNNGTLFLLEKLDLQDGKLVVNGGTVIALSSTNKATVSAETNCKDVSISGYTGTSNLVYGNWFRITDGTKSIVLRLPKSYEDKLSITCISSDIEAGTYTFEVGTYQVGEKINSFVYIDGIFTPINSQSLIIN